MHALIASPENHKKDWLKLTHPSQGTLDCEHFKEKRKTTRRGNDYTNN